MKICLVNSFYPPYIGGAETHVSNLARQLSLIGHDVTVYCSDRPLGPGQGNEDGVRVVRMRTPLTLYGTPITAFPTEFLTGGYDVIHCNFPNPYFTVFAAAIGKLTATPTVLTWHNDLPPVTRVATVLVAGHNALSMIYLRSYSRIISTTNVYAKTSKILRYHRKKVRVVPNGVDIDRFNPGVNPFAVKERYRLDGYKTLIFVGALTRWHAYKGVDVLIRAFTRIARQCEKLKLMIVGGGNMLDFYRAIAGRLFEEGRIIFTGAVTDSLLPALYAASDFAVLPSTDSSEGYGLVLLEAMACGRTVIGSDVGGIPEVVQDGKNGFLVQPADPVALANTIHNLYSDDSLRTKMGSEGRKFAETRSWGRVGESISSLYQEIQRK